MKWNYIKKFKVFIFSLNIIFDKKFPTYKKVCVVEDFMDSEFILSFGNLCDDESRKVKDFATYTPLTK